MFYTSITLSTKAISSFVKQIGFVDYILFGYLSVFKPAKSISGLINWDKYIYF